MGELWLPGSGEPRKGSKQGSDLVDLCCRRVCNGLGKCGSKVKEGRDTSWGPRGAFRTVLVLEEGGRAGWGDPSACVASQKTQTASRPSFPPNLPLGFTPGIREQLPLWAPRPEERVPWAAACFTVAGRRGDPGCAPEAP